MLSKCQHPIEHFELYLTGTWCYSESVRARLHRSAVRNEHAFNTAYYGVLPPYQRSSGGAVRWGQVQVEMECQPGESVSREQLISEVSDAQLVQHLCRARAVFSFTADGSKWNAWPPTNRLQSCVVPACLRIYHSRHLSALATISSPFSSVHSCLDSWHPERQVQTTRSIRSETPAVDPDGVWC